MLCGETGSGKTTQVPQICLRAGRGSDGLIGHTQPRRLAARSVAARLASETGTAPGSLVAYKIRFTDQTGPDCRIKIMTDGILLQELRRDRRLSAYDTLIIDEAHERSVNIDFLLGYLKTILPRRPDLRVVIMSATIDPQRFSAHFADAPVVEVSGRTYPVEVRYRPPAEDADGLLDALLEGLAELDTGKVGGDVLVFLPGERDIRDAATAIAKRFGPRFDVLPLFARLAAHEQDKIFSPGKSQRVILATNVAETSITVPGVAAVIDTGLARISRYSHQSKIQRLPIEPISQASAQQRSGRCGRVRDGICLRLYAQADFDEREAYSDPEILRTNLAGVLLRMADLGLGDIEAFPFPDPPDVRLVRDGKRLLAELQALDDERLTRIGRKLARLPVDPRFGRMLLAAGRNGSLREMLVIVSALSIADPAERRDVEHNDPDDDWRHPRSELTGFLNLWDLFHRRQRELSGNRLRKWCRRVGLSFLRMREWQDVHRQLRRQCHELKLRLNKEPAGYRAIHEAGLSGLLSQIGEHHDGPDYHGARNLGFRLAPGTDLVKRPKWVVSATIRQTHRAYASQVATVQPGWIERAGRHLVRRRYSEPYWDRKRQRVMAAETVSLYGLVLRADRQIDFAAHEPREAARVFTRDGLARGDYDGSGAYRTHNEGLARELVERSARLRRTDVLPDVARQAAFFRARLPADCNSPHTFEQWRKQAERDDPRILFMAIEDVSAAADLNFDRTSYPDELTPGSNAYPLAYRFAPAETDDGVSLRVPVAAVSELDQGRLDWLIPGLLPEKVATILRGLPKALRRRLVPAPQRAREFVASTPDREKPFFDQLAVFLTRASGEPVSAEACRNVALPDYLRLRVEALDDESNAIAASRDVGELRDELGIKLHAALALSDSARWHRERLTDWDFDELPRTTTVQRQGITIEAAPGLEDRHTHVDLRLFEDVDQAQHASRRAVARLLALRLPQQAGMITKRLRRNPNVALLARAAGGSDIVADELVLAAITDLAGDRLPRDRAAFTRLADEIRAEVVPRGEKLAGVVAKVLERHHAIRRDLDGVSEPAREDIATQLAHLVFPGFISMATAKWLEHYPRYLDAIAYRMESLSGGRADRDLRLMRDVQGYWQRWLGLEDEMGIDALRSPAGRKLRFMIEEYRVSLFAQRLGTSQRVSPRRLDELFAAFS